MKKLLWISALSALLLAACGDETKEEPKVETSSEQVESMEPTQEELNAQLKKDATAIDFVAANGDEIEANTKVTISGKVSNVASQDVGGTFTVTTTENDGVGMYTVENYAMAEIVDGSTVTVYGVYKEKDESGFPTITATIIE
ncbi:hypothetical protein [Solibacillus isronensis]|uniref:hypothetical protein n=1 Tax=Solibacillus isronensis TaxID=412383 RepID=UPI0039A00CB1